MKKYYTPKIEEFHVGFEFEAFVTKQIGWRNISLRADGRHLDMVINELKSDRIRVKYLDQEDIESLGWEYVETLTLKGTRLRYSFNNFILDYIPSNNLLALLEDNFSCRFNCVLKNKSELRKLMKQLNII